MFYFFIDSVFLYLKNIINLPLKIIRLYYLHRESINRNFYLSNSVSPFYTSIFLDTLPACSLTLKKCSTLFKLALD